MQTTVTQDQLNRVLYTYHHDPFEVLGTRREGERAHGLSRSAPFSRMPKRRGPSLPMAPSSPSSGWRAPISLRPSSPGRRRLPVRYPCRGQGRPDPPGSRSVQLPARPRRPGPASSSTRATTSAPMRSSARISSARQRQGGCVRRVGAQRRARQRHRRLQPLGWPDAPAAPAWQLRHLGTVHPGFGRGHGLQVRGQGEGGRCWFRRPIPRASLRSCALRRPPSCGTSASTPGPTPSGWRSGPRPIS